MVSKRCGGGEFDRRSASRVAAAVAATALLLSGGTAFAQKPPDPAPKGLAEIVVTAAISDAAVKSQVILALNEDRYASDAHVTVTAHDGVVVLEGFVTDEWDLQALRRAAKRVPGVTRVVNKLDLVLGGE